MNQLERARHLVAMADAQEAGEQIQTLTPLQGAMWMSRYCAFNNPLCQYRIKPKVAVGGVLEIIKPVFGEEEGGYNIGDVVQVIYIKDNRLLCAPNTLESISKFKDRTDNSGLGLWWIDGSEYKESSEPAAKPPIKKWLNLYADNGVASIIGEARYNVHDSEESAREARTDHYGEVIKEYLGTLVCEVPNG